MTLLAVPNVSEGRDATTLQAIGAAFTTGGARLPAGARLAWQLGHEEGQAPLPEAGPMSVIPLPLVLRAPASAGARAESIELSVLSPDGAVLSEASQPDTG